jgi:hypothetical protein
MSRKPFSKWFIRAQYLRGFQHWTLGGFRSAQGSFTLRSRQLPYFQHSYNFTWMNERTVEVPIARAMMGGVQPREILEVGNVLSHYDAAASHTVVDKYEPTRRSGCSRCDVLDFHPERKYRMVLSLSTLEHVGWDETPVQLEKAGLAILHLKSLLAPDGFLFLTIPLGYHPTLEDLFFENRVPDADAAFLLRTSSANEWAEVEA